MWNYRIIHYNSDKGMGLKNHYGLYEVMYNDRGQISAHAEEPEIIADSPEELIKYLEMMLSDAKKHKNKILDYKNIKFSPFYEGEDEDHIEIKDIENFLQ